MDVGPLAECRAHGVPNLLKVRDNVYRSGQPTAEGAEYLRTLFTGRKVHVLKLNFDDEGDDSPLRLAGFDVHSLGIEPRTNPGTLPHAIAEVFEKPDAEVWKEIFRQVAMIPTHDDGLNVWLVHCEQGNDRTGLVCGLVRLVVDCWTGPAAYTEMLRLGFHPEFIGLDRQWHDL